MNSISKLDVECSKYFDELSQGVRSDETLRSLLKEKEVYGRFLDAYATHSNLGATKDRLVQENVFGISQEQNMQLQTRNLTLQLLRCLITPNGSAIIDIDRQNPVWQISPRQEEIPLVIPVLVETLLHCLTSMLVPLPSGSLSASL